MFSSVASNKNEIRYSQGGKQLLSYNRKRVIHFLKSWQLFENLGGVMNSH